MKLAFIGCGNMGGAILCTAIKHGALKAEDAVVFDRNPRGRGTALAANVSVTQTLLEAVRGADMIVLAVKPKDAAAAIKEAGVTLEGKALLSIVAGLSYAEINSALGKVKARVLVTMPNMPILVGCGCTGFTKETTFSQQERKTAEALFGSLGIVEWVSENKLFAFSAIAGSSPAFTAMYIEALADAAVLEGLSRNAAYRVVSQAVMGSARLISETEMHPAIIKDSVSSPGGMTIEGVKTLEKGGFRGIVMSAFGASAQKFFRLH
ncbi:MAG: pyrroline-5-carboxylate reductase [Termitinemataceae bacterium]|nr:MAG: pyrroline-5-carboxylate reductase [Termitinemataceae bacterium]